MARLATAEWDPMGATPGGSMDPRVMIFHVTAVEGMARPHSGLEWHFHVAYDGTVVQLVDTNQQAAANYKANPFAISVETEGLGDGWWTDPQMSSLVEIAEWAMAEHPLLLRQRCDRWDGSGFGFHTMWGAPSNWTPVAKSCPGPNRKIQFETDLLPRILDPHGDDDMFTDADRATMSELRAIAEHNRWNRDVLDGIASAVASLSAGDGASAAQILDALAERLKD